MKDHMSQKIGGRDDVCCLPNKRKVGKEDIDEKILIERNTGVIPTEQAEKKVSKNKTKNNWCRVDKTENNFI